MTIPVLAILGCRRLVSKVIQNCRPALAECFREHGYEGTSLALISKATGMGKGSLYNAFPNGKEQMLTVVLEDISEWFEIEVFAPLRASTQSAGAIEKMLDTVTTYFRSGRRACLIGSLSVSEPADPFRAHIQSYFSDWRASLTDMYVRTGQPPEVSKQLAEEILAVIQGAIILSRALNDPTIFDRAMSRIKQNAI